MRFRNSALGRASFSKRRLNTHLYLRASTKNQDAHRAKIALELFAADKGLNMTGVYAEIISGTKLNRSELMRLLGTAEKGEVLLVEFVDRLSRLLQTDSHSRQLVRARTFA